MKSKAIKQTLKLTPEQTASLMADNGSDYRLKSLGQSNCKLKKVDEMRKRIMAMDWNFVKMLIYQNKQGKNRAFPK